MLCVLALISAIVSTGHGHGNPSPPPRPPPPPSPPPPPGAGCTVSLTRQESSAKCTAGESYGCTGNAISASVWVLAGCRGRFMCNDGGASHRALECASLGQNKSMCPCNKPSPPPPSPPPPPPSPGKGGKVGAGPLALMAGGGLVAVYCGVGILVHKKRGLNSTIPNASFWRGLPSLVRDGVGFFFWCCRRRAGLSVASAYNSYEEL